MALTINATSYDVRIPKGTAGTLKVDKVIDEVETDFTVGEVVYLQVKEKGKDATALITKEVSTFTDGQAWIQFDESDTSALDITSYIYDILWKDTSGKLIRLLPTNEVDCTLPNFIICKVVTTDV